MIFQEVFDSGVVLKGVKCEYRNKRYGAGNSFPDNLAKTMWTILFGEDGMIPYRVKSIIQTSNGRYRRLLSDGLGQLRGFPKVLIGTDMAHGSRVFCTGSALCFGILEWVGRVMRGQW